MRFHRVKTSSRKEHWVHFLVCLAFIFDGLVTVLSLGYFASEVRIWLLFDVFNDV